MDLVPNDLAWYIHHQKEERYLEYKAAMPWSDGDTKVKVAKAIVAMSNLRGGGVVVVGMREITKGVWEPEGVSGEALDSFKQDDIASWVNERFTPATRFSTAEVLLGGKSFLLIQVQEFEPVPVICRTAFTLRGEVVIRPSAIYYRSKRKVESAEVGSEEDMRDLIELAVSKGVTQELNLLRGLGLLPAHAFDVEEDDPRFERERGGIVTNLDVVPLIKSRAFWRVEVRPRRYAKHMASRQEMESLLGSATVSFRGWPYPHYEMKETKYTGDWLEGGIDWEEYKEYWRLYESGQWVHLFALHSAWLTKERLFSGRFPKPPDHAGYLFVLDTLFTLTEIFRFAVGMSEHGVLEPIANVSIQLLNTSDYMLSEGSVFAFPETYVNQSDRPISQVWRLSPSQLRAEADDNAVEMAVRIFSVFGWSPTEAEARGLAEDQAKLVERRLRL